MQTFLPYPNFKDSAEVLDRQRLGKQRVETLQIMSALLTGKGWINHPATKMWQTYEWALLRYQMAICMEWSARGYEDTCYQKTFDLYHQHKQNDPHVYVFPHWLGDYDFHESHRSNLVRKDPMYYLPLFGDVPPDLDYVWPVPNLRNRGYRMPLNEDLMLRNVKLMFRNFAGAQKQFNSEGDRNFCVFLEPDQAEDLKSRGWNVKSLRPREEGDEPQYYLQVSVNYDKGRPPRVVLVNSRGRLDLGAGEVGMLDYAEIKKADITVNPYAWEVQGKSGIKAYLKIAFITLDENELELEYADVPDANPPRPSLSSTAIEEHV